MTEGPGAKRSGQRMRAAAGVARWGRTVASLSLGMLGAVLLLGAVWVIIFPQVLAPPRSAQLLEAVDTAAERAAIEQRDVELLNGIRAGALACPALTWTTPAWTAPI